MGATYRGRGGPAGDRLRGGRSAASGSPRADVGRIPYTYGYSHSHGNGHDGGHEDVDSDQDSGRHLHSHGPDDGSNGADALGGPDRANDGHEDEDRHGVGDRREDSVTLNA